MDKRSVRSVGFSESENLFLLGITGFPRAQKVKRKLEKAAKARRRAKRQQIRGLTDWQTKGEGCIAVSGLFDDTNFVRSPLPGLGCLVLLRCFL